jgi:hypothetical protein
MTNHKPQPSDARYRVVVKANDASRRRGFSWEIVLDDTDGIAVVRASRESFKTLQRAYDNGCAALAQFGNGR